VLHRLAHALAVLAEHQLSPPALALIWDGSGLGSDGQLWGGELLRITPTSWQRLAHLHSFPLPGGDRAAREPRRAALGLLWELCGKDCLTLTHLPTLQAFSAAELKALVSLLRSGHCPRTSSVGRLFDGVVSLAGLVQRCSFEGQAAMRLETACEAVIEPLALTPDWDWRPWLRQALAEPDRLPTQLHGWLLGQAIGMLTRLPEATILLGGGCFQNRLLLEALDRQLSRHGRQVLWPQQLPPNDGGLALGQAIAARYALTENWSCASPSPV
jgi:hydrogenase maturation protein HypF